jgi:soluble lytic murein transglycosylase-like protein
VPPVFISNDDYQQFQGDTWAQQAQGQVADQWAQQANGNAPSMVADAADRAQQSAQAQQAVQQGQDQQAGLDSAAQQGAQAGIQQAATEAQNNQNAQDWTNKAYSDTATKVTGVAPLPSAAPAPAAAPSDTSAPAPAAVAPDVTASAAPSAPAGLPSGAAGNFVAYAWQAAQKAGIDPNIFVRQIQQESGFNPTAKSGAGAQGIAQIMPATAKGWGVDPSDPLASLDAAATHMAGYLQSYGGDWAKALAAYNAGPGNVDKFGGVPPFAETQKYVSSILGSAGPSAQDLLNKAGTAAQGAGTVASSAIQAPVQSAQDILAKANPFIGNNYVWGGKSPQQGFDCSGLAGYLTTGQPESTTSLYGKSTGVGADQAQPGDLVFWNMNSSDPHEQHVAVYLGNGQIVQSGGDQTKVNIGSVNQSIGSAPEFRRVSTTAGQGQPAQANAPAGAPPPNAPPGQPGQPAQPAATNLSDYITQYQAANNGAMPDDQAVGNFVMGQMQPAAGGAPPPPPPPGGPNNNGNNQNQQQPSPLDTFLTGLGGAGSALGGVLSNAGQTAQGALGDLGQGAQAAGTGVVNAAQSPQVQGALGTAGDLASGGITRAFNNQLQDLGQNVIAPPINAVADALNPAVTPTPPLAQGAQALSQQDVPFLSGAAGVAAPFLAQPGALDALMNPNVPDSQRMLAVGGVASPLALEQGGGEALANAAGRTMQGASLGQRLLGIGQDAADATGGATMPIGRTPIGQGGLGTPNYNFAEGSPEQQITQVLRNAASTDETGRARLTSEQMSQLPGMPTPDAPLTAQGNTQWNSGQPPALDDWRSAIDAGIQHSQWYSQFAKGIANTVGRANIPEFSSLFGITSPQAKVDVNLSQTLALMRMAREFEANGTPFTEQTIQDWVHATDSNGVQTNGILKNDGTPGGWQSWTGQKAKQVAQLYSEGSVEVPSNAKTPSYAGNIISALNNQFDPNSTIDTWMFQLGGYQNNSKAASEDLAYRAMRTVNGHLAGELGITPNQAQAAAWFGMKAVKDFADTAGAPQALKSAIADYGKPGSTTTLGDLVAMGKNEGGQFGDYGNLFDSPSGTWQDTINTPKIAHQLGMLPDNITDTTPPGAASAGQLTYPGQTTKAIPSSFPVTPEDTAARRTLAEGQAPVVTLPGMSDNIAQQLGYDPQTSQFSALGNMPHIVDASGDTTKVLIPGGNVDAALYAGATVNKAAGTDAMDVHMFTPQGQDTIGYHVVNSDGSNLDGPQAEAVRNALDAHDLQYSASPDGTIVRVHAPTSGADEAFQSQMAQALDKMPNLQVEELKGVAQSVGAGDYDQIIQRYASRYGAPEQPGVQAGNVDLGGTEAGAGAAGGAQTAGYGGALGGGGPGGQAPGANAATSPQQVIGGAQAGAVNPRFATSLGGAAAGGLAGYNSDPNADEQTKIERAAAGALAGAGLGYAAGSIASGGVDPWAVIQAERVGSMAGGVSSLAHIALNTPIQAMWKVAGDAILSVKSPETIPMEFFGAYKGLAEWLPTVIPQLTAPGKLATQIGGVEGQAVETGLMGLVKTHGVLQDFASSVGTNMELWRLAGEQAAQNSVRFSPQWWNDVNKIAAAPPGQMTQQAQQVGQQFALRGPLGQTGSAIQDFLQASRLGRLLNPFFGIGAHVVSGGIERSPLGALGTAADVARAPFGFGPYAATVPAGQSLLPGASRVNWGGTDAVTALGPRLRNNILGLGAAVWAFNQAAQGNITGNGPSDPAIRAELTKTGWAPNSVRIGGRYFSLNTLGVAGWGLAQGANVYEATHTGDQGGYMKPDATLQDQLGDVAGRMSAYVENETFLKGIGDLAAAMQNKATGSGDVAYELGSMGSSLIPQGSLIGNAASAMDPFQRKIQTGDIGQQIENRIPGLRETLNPKLGDTGQPLSNPQAGLGVVLPRSSVIQDDPVANMLLNVGMSPPVAPKTIRAGNEQVQITPDEQYQYQTLRGAMLQQMMGPLTSNAKFLQAQPQARKQVLTKMLSQADSVAQRQLLGQIAQGGALAGRLTPQAKNVAPQSFGPPMSIQQYQPQGASAPQQNLPVESDMATLSPELQMQLQDQMGGGG